MGTELGKYVNVSKHVANSISLLSNIELIVAAFKFGFDTLWLHMKNISYKYYASTVAQLKC